MSADAMWRWLDSKGVHREVDAIMLHEALRSGRLDKTVPVWRKGMESFEPANQVPELLIWCRSAPKQPPINRGPVGTVVPATGAARDAMMRMARQAKEASETASATTAENKSRSSAVPPRPSDPNKASIGGTSVSSALGSKPRGSQSVSTGQRQDILSQQKRKATLMMGLPVSSVPPSSGATGSEASPITGENKPKSRVSMPPPVPSAAAATRIMGSRASSSAATSSDSGKEGGRAPSKSASGGSAKRKASDQDLEVLDELDISELEDASPNEEEVLVEDISEDVVSSGTPSSPPRSGAYGPISASSPPPPRLSGAAKYGSKPPTPLGSSLKSVFDVGAIGDSGDRKTKADKAVKADKSIKVEETDEAVKADKDDKVAKEHNTVLDGSGDKLTVALTGKQRTSDSEGASSRPLDEVALHGDSDAGLEANVDQPVESATDAGEKMGRGDDAARYEAEDVAEEYAEGHAGHERDSASQTAPGGLPGKRVANRRMMMVVGGAVGVAALVLVVAGLSRLWSKKEEPSIDRSADKAVGAKDEVASSAVSSVASGAVASAQAVVPTGASDGVEQPGADGAVKPDAEPTGSAVKGDPGQACKPTNVRKRLVVGASKDVPLETWSNEEALQFAIGFAGLNNTGIGFVLDPITLDTKRSFTKRAPEPIIRVVPVKVGDNVDFELDTSGPSSPVGQRLTVSSKQLVRLGTFKNSLTISTDKDALPSVLWQLPGDKELDVMRAIQVGEAGLGLVFRSDGALWMGWVDGDNKPVGQLEKVGGTGVRVGTPYLAYNGSKVLLTFADQQAKGGGWGIRTVMVGYGEVPPSSQVWQVPSGGPEGDVISPTSLGLRDGRWVMVWTQGNTGSRVVRVQTLSRDLAPIGEAFVVSRQGSNAGQGLATLSRQGGAVVYLSLLGKTYEVWGAGMTCGSSGGP